MPVTVIRQAWTFVAEDGSEPFADWFQGLQDVRVQARIAARVRTMTLGSLGDSKELRGGIREARIHLGAGWRIYYALDGKDLLILLVGGMKKSQMRDLERAEKYRSEYERTKAKARWQP